MAEIRWTLEAELWLKDFYDYIALDNPHAADQVIDGNYNTAQILKDRPKLVTNMKHQKRKKSAFFSMAIIELPMPCYRTELIYWEYFMVLLILINICKRHNQLLQSDAKQRRA